MPELTTWWTTAGKEVINLAVRGIPQRFLRWRWPDPKLLGAITIFADAQPAIFYVDEARSSHDLECMNFRVLNLSPLQLALVGAELEIQINSTTLLTSNGRFATEIPLMPFALGGFPFRQTLSERQSQTLREVNGNSVRIRVTGKVIVKSPFGEHRKDLHADVAASIVR